MSTLIPQSVIGALSEILPPCETHASIDSLFLYANAPGDPPDGSKPVKVQSWLRRVNKSADIEPLEVLGKILERYLDEDPNPLFDDGAKFKKERNDRIRDALVRSGLTYARGGVVGFLNSSQVKSLKEEIRKLNIPSIDYEFKRAVENVDSDQYEAVSAACNILESICKVVIERRGIPMPKVQDLASLWKVVKKELGLDPEMIGDQDIQQILSGLSAIVSGTAALRTHTSSAHGRGTFRYALKKRHALLAIHSAHSLALFIIQTWQEKFPSP